jgi:hypothetical protein
MAAKGTPYFQYLDPNKLQLRRVNPYDGLAVDAALWNDAHNFHRNQSRLAALSGHGPGVVVGLEVLANDPPDRTLLINSGVAIDPDGNYIVVPVPQKLNITGSDQGLVYVVLQQKENSQTNPAGVTTHVLESFQISEYRQKLPAEAHLELARFNFVPGDERGIIRNAGNPNNPANNEVDLRFRREAAVRPAGSLPVLIGQLFWGNGADPAWAAHWEGTINLWRELVNTTSYRAEFKGGSRPGDRIVNEGYSLLVMNGNSDFNLTETEINALKKYLDQGGVLYIEAATGAPAAKPGDDAFSRAAIRLASQLDRKPVAPRRTHPLFRAHYVFGRLPVGFWGEGTLLEDNGLVISYSSYGALWEGGTDDRPAQRGLIRDALEMGVNLAAYAEQRRCAYELRRKS